MDHNQRDIVELEGVRGVGVPGYFRAPSQLASVLPETLLSSVEEDDLGLSNIISRTFDHPDITSFLGNQTDFSAATDAYNAALDALEQILSPQEMTQLRSTLSIQDLHSTAVKAQQTMSCGPRSTKIRNLIRILHRYSGVFDAVSQSYADYSALAWAAIKWLLIVAMNYVSLLDRLSTMLDDLSYNLPRFLLYRQLFSTSRMSRIISELYAAILDFLHQAITFFRRRRVRRYFSFLWGPMEQRFNIAMERIQRIQGCAERDASAIAIAQQQMENTSFARRLSELTLITRHTYMSILDVKAQQSAILLNTIRIQLFHGSERDYLYQSEIVNAYSAFVSDDWRSWLIEDRKHVPWSPRAHSGLTHLQLESTQPAMATRNISENLRAAPEVPQASLFWCPGMKKISAVACLIFQLLERYPDRLLYRETIKFYVQKFRFGRLSFNSLWKIFIQLITALPEFFCVIVIHSDEPDAVEFIRKIVDYSLSWGSTPRSLLMWTCTNLSESTTVELDTLYDVDPILDVTDSLFRVALLELGFYRTQSSALQDSFWFLLWRNIRYNMMTLTYRLMIEVINLQIEERREIILSSLGECRHQRINHDESTCRRHRFSLEQQLKLAIIKFLSPLPIDLPREIFKSLRQSLRHQREQWTAGRTHTQKNPSLSAEIEPLEEVNEWQPVTLNPPQRHMLWAGIETILATAITTVFQHKVPVGIHLLGWKHAKGFRTDISETAEMHIGVCACSSLDEAMGIVGETFSARAWDVDVLLNTYRILEQSLQEATDFGLHHTLRMYLVDQDTFIKKRA